MPESINYGISGVQNIAAQNIAVGENSRIEQSNWSEAFAPPLADLARAIDAFQGPTETREALQAAQAEVTRQLQAPTPDKSGIIAKLASVSQLAGSATAIVHAAAALTQAIATIL
jgi:hypothetical protein